MKRIISTFTILLAAVTYSFAQISPVKVVTGNITGNVHWKADTIYQLEGKVYVKATSTLTIDSGTIIKGKKGTGSALIVTRDAKIYAIGSPSKPIVFTSSETPGNRAKGDWGGLVIAGKAKTNVPGGEGTFEGGNLANPDGAISDGKYGGSNDADNSGELRYVRIEYAGFAFAPNSELNSLTMGGVGSGTKISHVQCSYGLDDSFEWFGGTTDADHLISFRGNDDDFDTDFGYSGRVQYGVCLRDTNVADISGAHAFESDNDATGTANVPKTKPVFSNMTLVGPKFNSSTTIAADFKRGAHIRRHSELSLFNSIIMGWPTGIKVDGDSCHMNADNGLLKVMNTVIAGCPSLLDSTAPATTTWPITTWFTATASANSTYTDNASVMLTNPFSYSTPDFRPTTGSPVLSGASFTDPKLISGFTPTTYVGAFGANDWTLGWTNFNPDTSSYLYGQPPSTVGVNDVTSLKLNVSLYPNPSKDATTISFDLKESSNVILKVIDLNGKEVIRSSYKMKMGSNQINLNTSNLRSGFYILKLDSDNYSNVSKLSIVH